MEEKQNPEEPVRQKPVRQKESSTPPGVRVVSEPHPGYLSSCSGCMALIGTLIGIILLFFTTCAGFAIFAL